MGGSAPQAPTPPDKYPVPGVRSSDAERDLVVAKLRDEYVAGRLSHHTFLHRVDSVLASKRQADLPEMVADLPEPQGRSLGRWFRGAWAKVTGAPSDGHRLMYPLPAPSQAQAQGRAPTTYMKAAPDRRRPLALQFPRGGGSQFSIGRDATCDLAIADMTVSRRHATLERTADGWLISDLESTNGTRVNGWRVRGKVPVRAGDLVSFGDLETVLLRGGDDPQPARREEEPPATAPGGGFAPS